MTVAPVVLVGQDGDSTRMVHRALTARFGPVPVVLEPAVSTVELLRRRRRRLGTATVLGQVLFGALVVPVLARRGRRRIEDIVATHHLDRSPLAGEVVEVPSVNSPEARAALQGLAPAVVVVNGTRIIGPETLHATDAVFVNTHMGITPAYRGVHGGYWALAEGRPDLVGTTVHLVDEGIDTGEVLGQATFSVTEADNFATYPYLHLGAGIPLLIAAVERLLGGDASTRPPMDPDVPSRLRTHPTIVGYLARRLRAGVR